MSFLNANKISGGVSLHPNVHSQSSVLVIGNQPFAHKRQDTCQVCSKPVQTIRLTTVKVVATQSGTPAGSQSGTPAGSQSKPFKKKVQKLVAIDGEVNKDLSNGMFAVKLENGVSVIAHLSGKIRQNRIKILVGDKVTVELSPYDLTRGRITYRHKAER